MSGLWRVVVTGPSGAEEWGSAEALVDKAQELMEACARCMQAKVVKLPYALYGAPWDDDAAPAVPARPQAFTEYQGYGRSLEVMDAAEAETYMQWLERRALEDRVALASLREEARGRAPIYCANVDEVPSLSLQAHEMGEEVTQEVVVAMWRSLKEKYEALELEARALREEDQKHRARGSDEKRLHQALANSEAARESIAAEIGVLRRRVSQLLAGAPRPRRYPHRGAPYGQREADAPPAFAPPTMAFLLVIKRPQDPVWSSRLLTREVTTAVDHTLGSFADVVMLEHMPELDEDLHAVLSQEEDLPELEEAEERGEDE